MNLGRDRWQGRNLNGRLRLKRPDAAGFLVTALDRNGYPLERWSAAETIELRPSVIFYLLSLPNTDNDPPP